MTERTLPLYPELSKARRVLADLLPLPGPITANIATVSACNFRCTSCPVSHEDYGAKYGRGCMTLADYHVVLRKLHASGVLKVVRLFGLGEPLLDPTLPEKLTFTNALGLRTETTTNGSRMTAALAERLVWSGLQYLRFSIYGLTREDFERRTGHRGDPELVVRERIRVFWETRQRLRSETPQVHITTLDAPGLDHAAFHAAYAGLCDTLSIEPYHNFAGAVDPPPNAVPLPHHRAVCPLPFYITQVLWDGRVLPCDMSPTEHVFGNLFTQSLDEVWNGAPAQAFRQAHLERRRATLRACAGCNWIHMTRDDLDDYHPSTG